MSRRLQFWKREKTTQASAAAPEEAAVMAPPPPPPPRPLRQRGPLEGFAVGRDVVFDEHGRPNGCDGDEHRAKLKHVGRPTHLVYDYLELSRDREPRSAVLLLSSVQKAELPGGPDSDAMPALAAQAQRLGLTVLGIGHQEPGHASGRYLQSLWALKAHGIDVQDAPYFGLSELGRLADPAADVPPGKNALQYRANGVLTTPPLEHDGDYLFALAEISAPREPVVVLVDGGDEKTWRHQLSRIATVAHPENFTVVTAAGSGGLADELVRAAEGAAGARADLVEFAAGLPNSVTVVRGGEQLAASLESIIGSPEQVRERARRNALVRLDGLVVVRDVDWTRLPRSFQGKMLSPLVAAGLLGLHAGAVGDLKGAGIEVDRPSLERWMNMNPRERHETAYLQPHMTTVDIEAPTRQMMLRAVAIGIMEGLDPRYSFGFDMKQFVQATIPMSPQERVRAVLGIDPPQQRDVYPDIPRDPWLPGPRSALAVQNVPYGPESGFRFSRPPRPSWQNHAPLVDVPSRPGFAGGAMPEDTPAGGPGGGMTVLRLPVADPAGPARVLLSARLGHPANSTRPLVESGIARTPHPVGVFVGGNADPAALRTALRMLARTGAVAVVAGGDGQVLAARNELREARVIGRDAVPVVVVEARGDVAYPGEALDGGKHALPGDADLVLVAGGLTFAEHLGTTLDYVARRIAGPREGIAVLKMGDGEVAARQFEDIAAHPHTSRRSFTSVAPGFAGAKVLVETLGTRAQAVERAEIAASLRSGRKLPKFRVPEKILARFEKGTLAWTRDKKRSWWKVVSEETPAAVERLVRAEPGSPIETAYWRTLMAAPQAALADLGVTAVDPSEVLEYIESIPVGPAWAQVTSDGTFTRPREELSAGGLNPRIAHTREWNGRQQLWAAVGEAAMQRILEGPRMDDAALDAHVGPLERPTTREEVARALGVAPDRPVEVVEASVRMDRLLHTLEVLTPVAAAGLPGHAEARALSRVTAPEVQIQGRRRAVDDVVILHKAVL